MTINLRSLIFVFLILCYGTILTNAQKTAAAKSPVYKISNLKIIPYDSNRGEFLDEIKADDKGFSFFNDYSISLMIVVEISAVKGGFETGRKVQITMTEGKKLKRIKSEQIPPIDDNEKYYVPVWLDAGMCDTIKITARLTGQKPASSMRRSVPFACGE